MSAHVVHSSGCVHVTLRVGVLVAQFYITRDGLAPPAYLYDHNGYGKGYLIETIEALPDALLPEVTQLVQKYRTHLILKGDT